MWVEKAAFRIFSWHYSNIVAILQCCEMLLLALSAVQTHRAPSTSRNTHIHINKEELILDIAGILP
jgi:hypothetical protein